MERLRLPPLRLARMSRIFHYDAHAVRTIVVGQIAKNPYTWIFHFDDGRNSLCGPYPQHRNIGWRRYRISIQRNNFEIVSRKRKATKFSRAAIYDMEHNALTGFHANRLAIP